MSGAHFNGKPSATGRKGASNFSSFNSRSRKTIICYQSVKISYLFTDLTFRGEQAIGGIVRKGIKLVLFQPAPNGQTSN